MIMRRMIALVTMCAAASACGQAFRVRDYPTPISLYQAGMSEFDKKEYGHAITAFDQVTLLLPPRDTLLPRAHYMLARSHFAKENYILAAATFKRLYEDFPEDSLADDALLGMADSEARIWRGPELDPHHAITALDSYSLVQRLFPNSPLVARAKAGEAAMNEGLARKDLNAGLYYMRRKLYDSALIPLRDAATLYPGTAAAKEAQIKMAEIYTRLKYTDDVADVCRSLRSSYPSDAAVARVCAPVRPDTAK